MYLSPHVRSSTDQVVQLHNEAFSQEGEPNPQWIYSSTELNKEDKQILSVNKGQLLHESKRTQLALQYEILYCLENG